MTPITEMDSIAMINSERELSNTGKSSMQPFRNFLAEMFFFFFWGGGGGYP